VPKSWRLLARQGEEWTSVQPAAGGFGVGVDAWQEVAFAPIECDGFKLEIAQQDGWSSGILELAYE
jgi:hypothetical protein